MYQATERLYITPDNKVLREEEIDQDTVASLLVGVGGYLTDERAKELGLTGKAKAKAEGVQSEPAPEPEPETKAEKPVADKAARPFGNKAVEPADNKGKA